MRPINPIVNPEELANARYRAGYSQVQLAAKAGISISYVAMIELGQRKPSRRVVEALANALGCPMEAFAFDPLA